MNEVEFLNKSAVYIQNGQLEKAQIILRRILTDSPNHPQALELSGDLDLKKGRIDEAIHRYEQACDNYTKNDQPDKAIICLEKIVHENKKNKDVYWRLADSYTAFGLDNQAIERILEFCAQAQEEKADDIFIAGLRKIVDMQSQNLGLHLSFVKVLRALDRKQEADTELSKLKSQAEQTHDEDILEEIHKLLPQPDGGEELDPKSRIELGNLLYEIGSKDEAVIEFEKAVSDLIESNEIDEAVNVLNRIVEIDPDNQEAIRRRRELVGEGLTEPQKEQPQEEPPKEEIAEEKAELAETVEEIIADMPEKKPGEEAEEAPTEQSIEGLVEQGFEPLTDESVAAQPEAEPTIPQEEAEQEKEPEPAPEQEQEPEPETQPEEEPESHEEEEAQEKPPGSEELAEAVAAEALEDVEPTAEPAEETTEEPSSEEEGLKLFDDLSKEIEGFVPVSEMPEPSAPDEDISGTDEAPELEGKIADIEFLLKQTEDMPQTFEITEQFDDFKSNIAWSEEDAQKKTDLAKMAFEAGLHETALHLTAQAKEQRNTWPLSIELNGKALVRLGRYGEAVRAIAPSLIAEEIPEERKLELRYLLASAYEGLGDFENAMHEIERIMSYDQEYKDVKELYVLMGGKESPVEQPPPEMQEKPAIVEGIPPSPSEPETVPEETVETVRKPPTETPPDTHTHDKEEYPTIVQEKPSAPEEKEKEKPSETETEEEERGENIAFL
jgi:tetratricopeptide (TPR) repeat protein